MKAIQHLSIATTALHHVRGTFDSLVLLMCLTLDADGISHEYPDLAKD